MGSISSPHSSDLPHDNDLPSLSSTHPINGIHSPKVDDNANAQPTTRQIRHNLVADRKVTEAAVKAAKAEIRVKLREDWAWPFVAETNASCPQNCEGGSWRERESDEEACPLGSVTNEADPYRFDYPDATARPGAGRKRKRREMLRNEMEWNDGLRHFMERRDAWTGASALHKAPAATHLSPTYPPSNGASSYHHAQSRPSIDPPSSQPTMMVPIAPPILPPDNAIRASIVPQAYPSLYSKIVVQGLSPTVPINLSDMVQALVQGWKRDGEWPPKSEPEKNGHVNGSTKGSGRRLARRSVGRVKRVLGIGNGDGEEGYRDEGGGG